MFFGDFLKLFIKELIIPLPMSDPKEAILAAFRRADSKELTMSSIVTSVYPAQMQHIDRQLKDPYVSATQKKIILQEKAKCHRRVSHHLQMLINDDILFCTRILAKGEKCYAPKIGQGEELIVHSKGRRIILSRPTLPPVPMEMYEQKNVLHKVMADDWVTRLNAILVEARLLGDVQQLQHITTSLFTIVNDVIGINHFEDFVQREYLADILSVLTSINKDAVAYDRRLSLVIDVTQIKDEHVIERFVQGILDGKHDNIIIVFDLTSREVILRARFFERIIAMYALARIKLNFKNDDILDAPILVGKAGPYTFNNNEWLRFKQTKQSSTLAVGCGMASVIVDLKAFFDEFKQASVLEDAMLNVSKSLFIANNQLRVHMDEHLSEINVLSNGARIDLFSMSRNWIRLWNYDPASDVANRAQRLSLLEDVKKSMQHYHRTQEIIYMSCGMPVRFMTDFSVAYRRFDKHKLLHQAYDLVGFKRTEDLYTTKNKDLLLFMEQMNAFMEYSNEVRLLRGGNVHPADILRELTILLTAYQVSFFCYIFEGELQQSRTLNAFLEVDDGN